MMHCKMLRCSLAANDGNSRDRHVAVAADSYYAIAEVGAAAVAAAAAAPSAPAAAAAAAAAAEATSRASMMVVAMLAVPAAAAGPGSPPPRLGDGLSGEAGAVRGGEEAVAVLLAVPGTAISYLMLHI